MMFINKFIYLYMFIFLNFFYFFLFFMFALVVFYFVKCFSLLNYFRNYSVIFFFKILLCISLIFSFILFLVIFFYYLDFVSNLNESIIIFDVFLPFFIFNLKFKFFLFKFFFSYQINFFFDIFSFVLLFLAYVVGFISFFVLDTRLYWLNVKYYFIFCIFVIIVYLFVFVNNLIFFFLLYECLLLPSFLFVYFISPSRRAIQASIYFLIWTQIGSFLVLIAVVYIVSISGCYDFIFLKFFKFSSYEAFFLFFLLFFGFGIKVPIWPFHYWLTKTHVEAPSGFSIYLSGFLVKSALFGFLKFIFAFNFSFNSILFIIFCFMGVFDSSLKMWGQNDLKKLVAYCTIQEMNLIYISFCFGEITLIFCGVIFCMVHAFLSSVMFFIVDCLYKRYHSRNIVEVSGIWIFSPNLTLCIFIMCIMFAGLPGTSKFIVEIYLFVHLLDYSVFFVCIFLFVSNFIGLVGFTKNWYNCIFGLKRNCNVFKLDLTVKELYIINFSFFFLIFFSFFFIIF